MQAAIRADFAEIRRSGAGLPLHRLARGDLFVGERRSGAGAERKSHKKGTRLEEHTNLLVSVNFLYNNLYLSNCQINGMLPLEELGEKTNTVIITSLL